MELKVSRRKKRAIAESSFPRALRWLPLWFLYPRTRRIRNAPEGSPLAHEFAARPPGNNPLVYTGPTCVLIGTRTELFRPETGEREQGRWLGDPDRPGDRRQPERVRRGLLLPAPTDTPLGLRFNEAFRAGERRCIVNARHPPRHRGSADPGGPACRPRCGPGSGAPVVARERRKARFFSGGDARPRMRSNFEGWSLKIDWSNVGEARSVSRSGEVSPVIW